MSAAVHPTIHAMVGRLDGLVALDEAGADRDTCRRALTDYETLRRFLQGFESRVAARLAEVSPTPQADTAHGTGSTSREAARSQERAKGRDPPGSQPGERLAAYASSVPVQEGIRDVIP